MSNEIKLKQLLELVEKNNELSKVYSEFINDVMNDSEYGDSYEPNKYINMNVEEGENGQDILVIKLNHHKFYHLNNTCDNIMTTSFEFPSIWVDNDYDDTIKFIQNQIDILEKLLIKLV